MSQFKVGDKVKVINVDRYTDHNSDQRKEMLGCTLRVRAIYYEEFTTGVFTGVPGEGVWRWHPDDLELVQMPAPTAVAEVPEPAGQPERTPFEIACDMFNPGDKIMILSANPMYPAYKRETVGTVQTIVSISAVTSQPIHTEINGEIYSCGWMPNEVRLATPEEIAANGVTPKPKPIRRGDLVRYKGEIWVVYSEGGDRHGNCSIASLTGESDYSWPKIDELTRIGTIRKKVKQLKAQVEDEK